MGYTHLASPITGGGVPVDVFEQIFLLARMQGMTTIEAWADFAQARLDSQSRSVVSKGKTITDRAAVRHFLVGQARAFSDKRLQILQGLGVAV